MLPDVEDTSIQADAEVIDVSVRADFDRTTTHYTWVNLNTEFSSLNQTETTLKEDRQEAISTVICTPNLKRP